MKGIHLPNAQFRAYTQQELDAVIDLGAEGILALVYPSDPTQVERIEQEAELCHRIGNRKPMLRLYFPNCMGLQPQDLAFETYLMHQKYVAKNLTPIWVCWNESNIPGERGLPPEAGLQEDWDFQVAYAKDFLAYLRMRLPDVRVYIPALSPLGNYLDGLDRYMELGGWDGICLHVYSRLDLADVRIVRNFSGRTPIITEWNQLPTAKVLATGAENYYFILDSADPAFDRYSLFKHPYLYSDFKYAQKPAEEEPMPQHEFVLGFKKLADKLGTAVVGEPTMPQKTIPLGGFGYTFQLTTKGQMVYTEGAQPLFLPATFPNP